MKIDDYNESVKGTYFDPLRERPSVIKAKDVPPNPKRSELTLLEILIQRNPERAKEFLGRLRKAIV